jgi:hypothetical protein
MSLPDSYSELYPGRFLKADALKGHKITFTIADMDVQELEGESGKKAAKVIVTFAKPQNPGLAKLPLELVLPKTNGECFRRMFGNNPREWVGHKVTLFPSTTKFGRETVDCIRIWGSPDIAEDMPITIPQGRKKALEMVMHKVVIKGATADAPKVTLDPRIETAFGILDWTQQDRADYLTKNAAMDPAKMLADLNAKIDARDTVEV